MKFVASVSAKLYARKILKWMWVGALRSTGAFAFLKRRIASQGGVIVLTFHRVLPDSEFFRTNSQQGLLVRERTFELLAEYVRKYYQVVSLEDIRDSADFSKGKPRIIFTFDDGWKDNATYAVPIATAHRIPVAMFVCTGRLGTGTPYWPERASALLKEMQVRENGIRILRDRLGAELGITSHTLSSLDEGRTRDYVIERLKSLDEAKRNELLHEMFKLLPEPIGAQSSSDLDATMSWEEIQALHDSGITFGSHTESHSMLTRTTASEVSTEVLRSKETLERHLGAVCGYFAYPNGDWSPEVAEIVRSAGYERAFINEQGIWDRSSNPFLIPRVNLWEGNLTNPGGGFSPSMFEHSAVWRAYFSRGVRKIEIPRPGESRVKKALVHD